MSRASKINLSNFSQTKPDGKHYWEMLEKSINSVLSGAECKGYPNLPHPKRLVAEEMLVPSFVIPEHVGGSRQGDLGKLLNMQYMFFKDEVFDIDAYATIIENRFPYLTEFLEKAGVDPHNSLISSSIEHYHFFHNSPIVQYTDSLVDLLRETSTEGLDKIPVRFLRTPYKCMYLNFTNASELPKIGYQEFSGAYVYETTGKPEELGEAYMSYMHKEPSLKRLIDSGYIDLEKEVVCLTVQLIGYEEDAKTIDGGCQRVTFSFVFNSDAPDEISVGDIVNAHTGGKHSAEDFSFSEMMAPLGLVFNSLLYMNSSENERKEIKEGTELEIKMKAVKNQKKLRKLEKQKIETYDFLRIGKTYQLEGVYQRTSSGWKVSPHIRRGHFRKVRYGKNLAHTKISWIMPMAIGAEGEAPSTIKVQ